MVAAVVFNLLVWLALQRGSQAVTTFSDDYPWSSAGKLANRNYFTSPQRSNYQCKANELFNVAIRYRNSQMLDDAFAIYATGFGSYRESQRRQVPVSTDGAMILDHMQVVAGTLGNWQLAKDIATFLISGQFDTIPQVQLAKFRSNLMTYERNLLQSPKQTQIIDRDQTDVGHFNRISSKQQYWNCQNHDTWAKQLATRRYAVCKLVNRNRHPALIFSPLKLEILSVDPKLVLFHDFTPKTWTKSLRQTAYPLLETFVTVDISALQQLVETRRNDATWQPVSNIFDPKLLKKIGLILGGTSTPVIPSKYIQVNRFGTADHHGLHLDVSESASKKRSQSFQIFLSDSIMGNGGNIIFPHIQISLRPEEGAALLWSNFKTPRDPDIRLEHAVCPVRQSAIWTAKLWFN